MTQNKPQTGFPGVVTALQKGGVSKTSLGLNVAERLANRGHDVVMIDLDHDCHLTSLLLDDEAQDVVLNAENHHIGKAMFGGVDPEELLLETSFGVDLLPSTNHMSNVLTDMKNDSFGAQSLRDNIVAPLYEQGYDFFLIDPPGGQNQMLDAAFIAIPQVLIPVTPEAGTINGLTRLFDETINPLRGNVNIDVAAITPNRMHDSIAKESNEQSVIRLLNNNYRKFVPEYAHVDDDVFETIDTPGKRLDDIPKPGIRERKAIDDAFREGLPVAAYDSDCDQIPNLDTLAEMVVETSHQAGETEEVSTHA